MCVAIAQKQGASSLTRDELERGWKVNPDGGGYAYIDRAEDKIVTKKFMGMTEFIESYLTDHAENGRFSPFLVHMRIATHGAVKIETCHPFDVKTQSGETAFIHNGIISEVDAYTSNDRSDTMAFRDMFLDGLPDDWLDSYPITVMMEDYIGWSKMAFLTTSDECEQELYVLNDSLGYWNNNHDTWFSNHSTETWTSYRKQKAISCTKDSGGLFSDDDDEWPWDGKHDNYTISKYSSPAMSLVVREEMNNLIVGDGWDIIRDTAIKQGYCEYCMFSPCQCDDTCHYCNSRFDYCNCINQLGEGGLFDYTAVSIGDMRYWVGDDDYQDVRKEELETEREAVA